MFAILRDKKQFFNQSVKFNFKSSLDHQTPNYTLQNLFLGHPHNFCPDIPFIYNVV